MPNQQQTFLADLSSHAHGKKLSGTWDQFNDSFTTRRIDAAALADHIQAGGAWCAPHAKVKHKKPDGTLTAYRTGENFAEHWLLALDVETEDERSTVAYWLRDDFAGSHAAIVHTTPSHTDDKPRCRVIFVLDAPIDSETYELAMRAMFHRWPFVDTGTGDRARFFFGAPACALVRSHNRLDCTTLQRDIIAPYVAHQDAEERRRQQLREQRQAAIGEGSKSNAGWSSYVATALETEAATVAGAPAGQRHHTLRDAAMRLASLEMSPWLDADARQLVSGWPDVLTDAAHANGYIGKYGAASAHRVISGARDVAEPREEPLPAASADDAFFVGDAVIVQRTGEYGTIDRVRTDQDGAWIHQVNGAWWPRALLRRATIEERARHNKQLLQGAFGDEVKVGIGRAADKRPPDRPPEKPPKKPKRKPRHTCKHGRTKRAAVTIYETETAVAPLSSRDWRNCDRCRYDLVERRVKQLVVELETAPLHRLTFATADEWTTKRKALNKRDQRRRDEWIQDEVAKLERIGMTADDDTLADLAAAAQEVIRGTQFLPMPQEDGSVVVLHNSDHPNDGGEPVPDDEAQLRALVDALLQTPAKKRMRPSNGFGKHWRHTRGDGRRKQAEAETGAPSECVQFIATNASNHKCAEVLDIDLNSQGAGRRDIYCLDSYQALLDADIELKLRKVHQGQNFAGLVMAVAMPDETASAVETPQEVDVASSVHYPDVIMDVKGDIAPESVQDEALALFTPPSQAAPIAGDVDPPRREYEPIYLV